MNALRQHPVLVEQGGKAGLGVPEHLILKLHPGAQEQQALAGKGRITAPAPAVPSVYNRKARLRLQFIEHIPGLSIGEGHGGTGAAHRMGVIDQVEKELDAGIEKGMLLLKAQLYRGMQKGLVVFGETLFELPAVTDADGDTGIIHRDDKPPVF